MTGINHILHQLHNVASLPLSEACGLPGAIYHHQDIFALEKQHILAKEWACIGRENDFKKAGDYITITINETSVFVIKGDDSQLRAFINMCRHRMTRLLQDKSLKDKANVGKIICPYHAWCYDKKGSLIAAPYMNDNFNKTAHHLHQIALEIWHGWVYISLSPSPDISVKNALQPLENIVERYQMQHYIPIINQEHIWKSNWKIICENFMECYHLPVAHRKTLGTWLPIDKTELPDIDSDYFTYHFFDKKDDATYGVAHHTNQVLQGEWRQKSVLANIFPTHMYVLAPDHLWYLSLFPQHTGQTQLIFGVAIAPEVYHHHPDIEKFIHDTEEFFDRVNDEDKDIVENIYHNSYSSFAHGGRLSWLEKGIYHFIQYLDKKLAQINKLSHIG